MSEEQKPTDEITKEDIQEFGQWMDEASDDSKRAMGRAILYTFIFACLALGCITFLLNTLFRFAAAALGYTI
jgi:hypothetical protein